MVGMAGFSWAIHLRRLKRHEGTTRTEFNEYFQQFTVRSETPGAVYDHFQKLGVYKGFMPRPSDTLEGTYKIVGEDVEDNLEDILRRLGYQMPHSGIMAEWVAPIETLEDVVRFMDWVATKQSQQVPGGESGF
jgi:hypothetical protein